MFNLESIRSTVTLNNGIEMPRLGLGVWQMAEGHETEQAVLWALEAGYRLIDTAKLYGNEKSVGRAVRASGIPRSEMFVTTKLWPTDFFQVEDAFNRSMDALALGSVDLYLIHWPIPLMKKGLWQELEKIYQSGPRAQSRAASVTYGPAVILSSPPTTPFRRGGG